MARKTLQREVTISIIKYGEIAVENEEPIIVSKSEIKEIGKISAEEAGRIVRRLPESKGKQMTVFNIEHDTKRYEMSLADFIEHATIVEE